MRTQSLFGLSLPALAMLAALPGEAQADQGRNPLAGQPAIRHREEMRKLRFEVTPEFLISLNQPFLIGVGGGLNLQFHINDWLGIAASFHYTGAVNAPLEGSVETALPNTYPTDPADPSSGLKQPSKAQFREHLIAPNFLGALYATLTPIGGKFALFNSVFANYDFYGMAGIGLANLTNPNGCPSPVKATECQPFKMTGNDVNIQSPDVFTGLRFAGMLGIGMHIYFNQWIGLQLEVRDYLYKANPGGFDVSTTDRGPSQVKGDKSPALTGDDEYITSNLYFGLGLTFMLPPSAKISR